MTIFKVQSFKDKREFDSLTWPIPESNIINNTVRINNNKQFIPKSLKRYTSDGASYAERAANKLI